MTTNTECMDQPQTTQSPQENNDQEATHLPGDDSSPVVLTPTNITSRPTCHTSPIHPSLNYPTREFLQTNFKKSELQKWCQELGLSNIWVTKSELIGKLIENSKQKQQNTVNSGEDNGRNSETTLSEQHINLEITRIINKLEAKD